MSFKFAFAITAIATVSLAPVAASAHNTGFQHSHQGQVQSNNGANQVVGGLIGATVGGVIGSQVAGRGSRTEGSVIGALVGGATGIAVASQGNGQNFNGGGNVVYSQPYYSNSGYYNGGYSQPYYSNGGYYNGGGFISVPRSSVNINIGTGFNRGFSSRRGFSSGFIGNRGFSSRRSFSGNRGFSGRRSFSGNRGFRGGRR